MRSRTPIRLDQAVVAANPGLSRSRAAALVRDGHVTLNGTVATKASVKVGPRDVVAVDIPAPVAAEAVPQDLPLDVVYQDAAMAVIDKAPGMVVHPSNGHPDGTLVNALLFHLEGLSGINGVMRPGIVHRLDQGTSGLLVVAKHDDAHHALAAQFADHSASRRYLALVHGDPGVRGTIRSKLARHPTHRLRMASTEDDRGKHAVTHFARVAKLGSLSLVMCRLETGRTHQIRVHLTERGHPLVGDRQYQRRGNRVPASIRELVTPGRPLLHAYQLALAHPDDGRACVFERWPPDDYEAVLNALGVDDVAAVVSCTPVPGPASD